MFCLNALALCLMATMNIVAGDYTNGGPTPCCLPPTFEGKTNIFQEGKHHFNTEFVAQGSIHVDINSGRFALQEKIYLDGLSIRLVIIEHAVDNLMYIIRPDVERCIKRKLPNPFDGCIAVDSTFMGTQNLGGLGSSSLSVNIWGSNYTEEGIRAFGKVYVSTDNCTPILFTMMASNEEEMVVGTQSYYDLTEYIRDEGVFIEPNYCHIGTDSYDDRHLERAADRHRVRRQTWF